MLETLSSQGSVRPRRLLRRTGNPNPTLRWSEHPSATLWRGAASFCISQVSSHVDSGSGALLHPGPYHFHKFSRCQRLASELKLFEMSGIRLSGRFVYPVGPNEDGH